MPVDTDFVRRRMIFGYADTPSNSGCCRRCVAPSGVSASVCRSRGNGSSDFAGIAKRWRPLGPRNLFVGRSTCFPNFAAVSVVDL